MKTIEYKATVYSDGINVKLHNSRVSIKKKNNLYYFIFSIYEGEKFSRKNMRITSLILSYSAAYVVMLSLMEMNNLKGVKKTNDTI